MLTDTDSDPWLPIPEALPLLRPDFDTEAAVRYHVARRHVNGLESLDVVRKTPLGLRLNVRLFKRWARGEIRPKAA